jgi:hypothetical protein
MAGQKASAWAVEKANAQSGLCIIESPRRLLRYYSRGLRQKAGRSGNAWLPSGPHLGESPIGGPGNRWFFGTGLAARVSVKTGCVDFLLSPAEIAEKIRRIGEERARSKD